MTHQEIENTVAALSDAIRMKDFIVAAALKTQLWSIGVEVERRSEGLLWRFV
jgi:hypothetical protein